MECASWLADAQVPFSLVFTKADKRKKGVPTPQQNIEAFQVSLNTCLLSEITANLLSLRVFPLGQQSACQLGDRYLTWQAALLRDFEDMPVVFHTDSVTSQRAERAPLTHSTAPHTTHWQIGAAPTDCCLYPR